MGWLFGDRDCWMRGESMFWSVPRGTSAILTLEASSRFMRKVAYLGLVV